MPVSRVSLGSVVKTKKTLWTIGVAAILCLLSPHSRAQTPAPSSVLGQVESVDAASRTIRIKTEDGASLAVALAEKGTVVKVAPGEKSLQNAAPIAFEGLVAGDRVLVRGGARNEGRIEGALRVVVMAKTDLAARDESEQRVWRERGVSGTLTATDPANGAFTIQTSAPSPAGPVSTTPNPQATNALVVDAQKATLHRYADGSVKFDEAKPAAIADMAEGDQVRVLGTRSADGARLTAERVVFGSFKTMALAIEHVDPATGLLSVKDLQSNRKFTISVATSGFIRRIPPEMAAMFAALSGGGGGRPGGPRPGGEGGHAAASPGASPRESEWRGHAPGNQAMGGGGQAGADPGASRPEGEWRGHAPGSAAMGGAGRPAEMGGRGPGGGGARSGRVMEDMLDKMPIITLADLKKGDWVGAVVSRIDASGKGVAFNLLAGIDVFASRANRSGGVDVGMPAGLLDGALGVP